MNGRDFLATARRLCAGADESDWRSAVSRAYYAAFHAARDLLSDLGFRVPRAGQAHAYLWLRLSNCGDPQVQLAGSDLNRLRRERNRSDYDIEQTLDHADTFLQILAAKRIVQVLDAAAADPTRTQITDRMKI